MQRNAVTDSQYHMLIHLYCEIDRIIASPIFPPAPIFKINIFHFKKKKTCFKYLT